MGMDEVASEESSGRDGWHLRFEEKWNLAKRLRQARNYK